jgi:adhesin transport system membrane fusion protein
MAKFAKEKGQDAAERSRMDGDLDFMSDLSAAVREQTPGGSRLVLWAVILFFIAAIFWASVAEIDEVTKGEGRVIPSRQVQVIQNLEGGILSEILVKEGDTVEPGQTILRIDDTRFASSFREGRKGYLAIKAKVARLAAEANKLPFNPPKDLAAEAPDLVERERRLFDSRVNALETNLGILQQQEDQRRQELAELKAKRGQLQRSYALVVQELGMTEPLVAEGAVSEVEVLRLKRQVNDLKGDLEATRLAIPRLESSYAEAQRKVEELELEFRNQAREELNDELAELERLEESNVALEDRVERTKVRSPVRGTVKQLMINTVGGVIQPGMDLVEIVPLEDTLLVEAKISPRDIAFLRPGQEAIVKFTAYDFAIYGGLEARLEFISADAITDEQNGREESYYQVRVRTKENHLGSAEDPLPIIPGMTTEVDILTGKKTVLTYLMKPVLRGLQSAMTER